MPLRLGWAYFVCVCVCVCASASASASNLAAAGVELAVIVHPESGVSALSRAEVINIFFGRQRRLPSGDAVLTVDLVSPNEEKRLFYLRLVGKEPAEVNSYWARLVFSGRGAAPWQAESPEEVLGIVENYKGAIGYVERHRVVDGRVKIVYTLAE